MRSRLHFAAALRKLFDAAGRIEVATGPRNDRHLPLQHDARLQRQPLAGLEAERVTNRLFATFRAPKVRPAFLAHREQWPVG